MQRAPFVVERILFSRTSVTDMRDPAYRFIRPIEKNDSLLVLLKE